MVMMVSHKKVDDSTWLFLVQFKKNHCICSFTIVMYDYYCYTMCCIRVTNNYSRPKVFGDLGKYSKKLFSISMAKLSGQRLGRIVRPLYY